MLLTCTCRHEAQDDFHGRGLRVHNFAKSACGKAGGWRCTVCGKEKPLSSHIERPVAEANKS